MFNPSTPSQLPGLLPLRCSLLAPVTNGSPSHISSDSSFPFLFGFSTDISPNNVFGHTSISPLFSGILDIFVLVSTPVSSCTTTSEHLVNFTSENGDQSTSSSGTTWFLPVLTVELKSWSSYLLSLLREEVVLLDHSRRGLEMLQVVM